MRFSRFLFVILTFTLLSPTYSWKPRSSAQTAASAAKRRGTSPVIPCIFTDPKTGASFDLSPLQRTGDDYTGEDEHYFYRMNICGPVNYNDRCGNALVCQFQKSNHNEFVARICNYDGYATPQFSLIDSNNPGMGMQVMYTNGDRCYINKIQRPRIAIVQYKCAAQTSNTFTVHEDTSTCTFTMTIESSQACWPLKSSSSSGLSGGTQFLILLTLIVGIYLALGCFYNRQYGATGMEAIPNIEFWRSLPGYTKDGFIYSWTFVQQKIFRQKTISEEDSYGDDGKGMPNARSIDDGL